MKKYLFLLVVIAGAETLYSQSILAWSQTIDSNLLYSATGNVPSTAGNIPVSGPGRRMMWYADKAAFRVGYVAGSNWDKDLIGKFSFASGYDTKASGDNSTAIGLMALANGVSSTAIGNMLTASGANSVAIGNSSLSSGAGSTAIGVNTTASGTNSIAIGVNTTASGANSTALGCYVNTDGKSGSFLIGDYNSTGTITTPDRANQMVMRFSQGYKFLTDNTNVIMAISPQAVNIGKNLWTGGNTDITGNLGIQGNTYTMGNVGIGMGNPSAKFSLATNGEELAGTVPSKIFKTYSGVLGTSAGSEIKLANFGFKSGNWTSLGIGAYRYNGADGWQNASIVFAYDVDNTSGAGSYFALCGNGNFGIGTVAPGAKLHVAGNILASGTITPSDIRYKTDIRPMKEALKKIMSLSGYYYSFKKNEFPDMNFDSKVQCGVIAQDVEKVLPEVVYTLQNGYKAVDYSKMIPLLIEGMKEQQEMIDRQQKQIDELQRIVVALTRR